MDDTILGLMLGCALVFAVPPLTPNHTSHPFLVSLAVAAEHVTWRDVRLTILCAESNPAARICLRSR